MDTRPVLTPEQAISATWVITSNLAHLFSWLVFWIAHLVLALLVMGLLWWFQVTPKSIETALLGASQSTTASVAGFLGLSVVGILSGYLTLAQWVWRRTYLVWQTAKLFARMPTEA